MSKISDRRRFEILQAAGEEFQKNGLQATSVSDIARRANIGKSTIYEYYPSKEVLIVEVGRWLLEQLLERLQSSFSGDAPLSEKLCRYLDSFSALPREVCDGGCAVQDMLQFMSLVGTDALKGELEQFRQTSCRVLAAALADAAKRREIPALADAEIAAQMMLALLNPVSVGQLRREGLESAAKEAVQTVLAGLRR